jgi:Tfp pilus assembly protein PilZ
MLSKLTKQLSTITPKGKPGAKAPTKGELKKETRLINTEKFAGGRGATTGVLRSEKRNGGRIRTSALKCEIGPVLDLSPGGLRMHSKKQPTLRVGDPITLSLKAEDQSMDVHGKIVWIRIDDNCEYDIGVQFNNPEAMRRGKLMQLAATAQASEGLTRGWSPMFKPV